MGKLFIIVMALAASLATATAQAPNMDDPNLAKTPDGIDSAVNRYDDPKTQRRVTPAHREESKENTEPCDESAGCKETTSESSKDHVKPRRGSR